MRLIYNMKWWRRRIYACRKIKILIKGGKWITIRKATEESEHTWLPFLACSCSKALRAHPLLVSSCSLFPFLSLYYICMCMSVYVYLHIYASCMHDAMHELYEKRLYMDRSISHIHINVLFSLMFYDSHIHITRDVDAG